MQGIPVKGLAHITGGGLTENIPRILPETLSAELAWGSWEIPPLFLWLREAGDIAWPEMQRTFNCGIGMVVAVSEAHADAAMTQLRAAGERVWRIGQIRERLQREQQTVIR
jgi:phosphoribosylformylglycinamidine cyclo-ligase